MLFNRLKLRFTPQITILENLDVNMNKLNMTSMLLDIIKIFS